MIPSKGMTVDADTHHGIHSVGSVAGCLCDGNPVDVPTALPQHPLLTALSRPTSLFAWGTNNTAVNDRDVLDLRESGLAGSGTGSWLIEKNAAMP
jgi:hypothetical protein